MKKKILTMLALLMVAASGAVAQSSVTVTEVTKNQQWQFTMPDYAVVANIEYDTDLALDEVDDNAATLEEWDGYEANVTLNRTLADGSWNTLALPFSIDANGVAILKNNGMSVKQLDSSTLDGQTLTLNFSDATSIEAGKPYLVKMTTAFDFSTQAFANVEVSKEAVTVQTDYVDFIPTLGKTTIQGVDAKDVLFLAAENKLKNPDQMPTDMKGFRAYFLLKNLPAGARAFSLNFGDETTAIQSVDNGQTANGQTVQYDLQGRRMDKAAQKGVYIQNGKKVVVK